MTHLKPPASIEMGGGIAGASFRPLKGAGAPIGLLGLRIEDVVVAK